MQAAQLKRVLGQNVRRRRVELRLTQADLDERLGVAQSYVSALEKGKKGPLLGTIAALADVLEVPPSYILSGAADS